MGVEWLGSFRGSDLEGKDLDAVIAYSINQADIETARSLYATKWWDYRFCHPGHGFFLYAHQYGQAVEKWRSLFGVSPFVRLRATDHPLWRDEKVAGKGNASITRKVMSPASHRTSLWRGMCFADSYGVPYDRWIDLGFNYAFECNWQRLPTPASLYTTQMVEAVLKGWEAEKTTMMHMPRDPRYLADNFEGHPYQAAFQDWLAGQIKARPRHHIALGQYLFRERLLTPASAKRHFTPEIIAKAAASVSP